jgi:hypothetical protein
LKDRSFAMLQVVKAFADRFDKFTVCGRIEPKCQASKR